MPILKLPPEWTLGENLPDVVDFKLSDGAKGNLETIEFMRKKARDRSRHPIVRQLALKILLSHNVPSQDYLAESLAIGRYVKQKVRYVRDINRVETLIDPLTLIDQITRGEAQADCDDVAMLIATLLLSIGHQPYFRIVKYKKDVPNFQHVYVVDYEKNHADKVKTRIVLDGILKYRMMGNEIFHLQGNEIKV